jgi:hypothetical protein
MTIQTDLFATLGALVGSRAYPDRFPQAADGGTWPAIRYSTVGGAIWPDISGAGTEETDDVRFQVDVVASTAAARDALVRQVRAAMATFTPPAVLDGPARTEFDEETKTFRGSLDFIVYGSSQ